jgi:hypothetical protein
VREFLPRGPEQNFVYVHVFGLADREGAGKRFGRDRGIGQPDISNPNSEIIVGRCRRLPTGERTGLSELHS